MSLRASFAGPKIVAAPPARVAYDTFTDGNFTLLDAHTPDEGGPWVQQTASESMEIVSGYIRRADSGSTCVYTIDTGLTAFSMWAEIMQKSLSKEPTLYFRWVSIAEYYWATINAEYNWVRVRKIDGITNPYLVNETLALENNVYYTLKVEIDSADNGEVFVDDASIGSWNDSDFSASVLHGVGQVGGASNPGQMDDFEVWTNPS